MNYFTLAISWDWSRINGFGLTAGIVGIIIVFLALVLLSYIYRALPFVLHIKLRSKLRKEGKHKDANLEDLSMTGEVNAAISMALILYFDEIHDLESNMLTIKKVSKLYTPWSTRAASMNTYFNKRK